MGTPKGWGERDGGEKGARARRLRACGPLASLFHWEKVCPAWLLSQLLSYVKSQVTGKKTLMLGKIEGQKRRGQPRMRWLDHITNSVDLNLSQLQEIVKDGAAWHAAVHRVTRSRHNLVTERQLSHHLSSCIPGSGPWTSPWSQCRSTWAGLGLWEMFISIMVPPQGFPGASFDTIFCLLCCL